MPRRLRSLVLAERDTALAERDRLHAEHDMLLARTERLEHLLQMLRRLQSERLPEAQRQLGLKDTETAIPRSKPRRNA